MSKRPWLRRGASLSLRDVVHACNDLERATLQQVVTTIAVASAERPTRTRWTAEKASSVATCQNITDPGKASRPLDADVACRAAVARCRRRGPLRASSGPPSPAPRPVRAAAPEPRATASSSASVRSLGPRMHRPVEAEPVVRVRNRNSAFNVPLRANGPPDRVGPRKARPRIAWQRGRLPLRQMGGRRTLAPPPRSGARPLPGGISGSGATLGGGGASCENTLGPTPHRALGEGGRSSHGTCRRCATAHPAAVPRDVAAPADKQ